LMVMRLSCDAMLWRGDISYTYAAWEMVQGGWCRLIPYAAGLSGELIG
jgi:hypothetical protein